MALQSKLFTIPRDTRLEECLDKDSVHITPGSRGDHVKNIQIALNQLSNVFLKIDGFYGPKTAAAVKAFKSAPSRRRRIHGSEQTTVNDIVGKRTLQSLDDEMDILENEEAGGSNLVEATTFGKDHDYSTCPKSNQLSGPDGRVSHEGTPINPLEFGRRINIGGEGETNYLRFEDFVTIPESGNSTFGPPRPFVETLPDKCAGNICMRSTPINRTIRRQINRIALPGCRLTAAGDDAFKAVQFLFSLGVMLEDITTFGPRNERVFVIAMRGDGRFLDR